MNMGKKKAFLLFLFLLASALDLEGSEEWLLQRESPPFLARGYPSVNEERHLMHLPNRLYKKENDISPFKKVLVERVTYV